LRRFITATIVNIVQVQRRECCVELTVGWEVEWFYIYSTSVQTAVL
jgi:hypothetical protein